MAVKEILDDRVIDLNMDAKNKDEVIRHLAGLLKNAGYIEDLEGYVRDVYVRESEAIPTAIRRTSVFRFPARTA